LVERCSNLNFFAVATLLIASSMTNGCAKTEKSSFYIFQDPSNPEDTNNDQNPLDNFPPDTPVPARDQFMLLGGGGSYNHVDIHNDYIFFVGSQHGIPVYSIHDDPKKPKYITYIPSFKSVAITIIGNLAYIAEGENGFGIYDIGDIPQVKKLGGYNTPGFAFNIAVTGNKAYVSDGNSGIEIFDISVSENPILLGSLDTNGLTRNVTVHSILPNWIFAADDLGGILSIDVSNPSTPFIRQTFPNLVGGRAETVMARLEAGIPVLYVTEGNAGVDILNVSDPNAGIFRITTFNTSGSAMSLMSWNNYVMIADKYNLVALNVGNLANISSLNPDQQPKMTLPQGLVYSVKSSNGKAIMSNRTYQWMVMDLSNMNAMTGTNMPNPGVYPYSVRTIGNTSYLIDGDNGVSIIDHSDPQSPNLVASYFDESLYGAFRADAVKSMIYIAAQQSGFQILNAGNLQNIFRAGGRTGNYRDVRVRGSLAYLLGWNGTLEILNVSNPSAMTLVSSVPALGCERIELNYPYVYVASGNSGVRIFDVSNSSNPVQIANVPALAVKDLAFDNGLLYFVAKDSLNVLDVNTPSTPVLISSIFLDTPWALSLKGTTLVTTAKDKAFQVYSIRNVSINHAPELLATYALPRSANYHLNFFISVDSIAIANNTVIATSSNGFIGVFKDVVGLQ
jgi:hypothetical protein